MAWRAHKQTYVALSTCEAEYVSMSEACQELMALHKPINCILNSPFYPMTVFCDSQAAISSAKTDGGTKLRHMTQVRGTTLKIVLKTSGLKLSGFGRKTK